MAVGSSRIDVYTRGFQFFEGTEPAQKVNVSGSANESGAGDNNPSESSASESSSSESSSGDEVGTEVSM